jgi:hypothetical protein
MGAIMPIAVTERRPGRMMWIVTGSCALLFMVCWAGLAFADDHPNHWSSECAEMLSLGVFFYAASGIAYFVAALSLSICFRLQRSRLSFAARAPFIRLLGVTIFIAGAVTVVESANCGLIILGTTVMFAPAFIQWYNEPATVHSPSPMRMLQLSAIAVTLIAVLLHSASPQMAGESVWEFQGAGAWMVCLIAGLTIPTICLLGAGWWHWLHAWKNARRQDFVPLLLEGRTNQAS